MKCKFDVKQVRERRTSKVTLFVNAFLKILANFLEYLSRILTLSKSNRTFTQRIERRVVCHIQLTKEFVVCKK
ncbi:MAG: hypothetical protein EBT61_21380 [Verrucomicrobia bacterium]|nr:hypothetical protein [Verrucomicrobiota bacterium]